MVGLLQLLKDAQDHISVLEDRIARAVATLDAAPASANDEASKRQARIIQEANLVARTILTEGSEPGQLREQGLSS